MRNYGVQQLVPPFLFLCLRLIALDLHSFLSLDVTYVFLNKPYHCRNVKLTLIFTFLFSVLAWCLPAVPVAIKHVTRISRAFRTCRHKTRNNILYIGRIASTTVNESFRRWKCLYQRATSTVRLRVSADGSTSHN